MIFKEDELGQVRVITKDNNPWFIALDVCKILNLGNVSLSVNGRQDRPNSGLDEDEKDIVIVNTPGGDQEMIIVSEAGLYSLVLKSRKPEAKKSAREQKGEPAYEVAERYELILYEVMKSLQELRRSGRATTQEWFNQNMVELIRKHVEQEVSPRDQLEVRDGENGTLIVSRKIRAFPGNKSVLAFEREIAFDEIEGKMYEVVRDTNGQITKKKEWSPFYSDVIDRGLQAA